MKIELRAFVACLFISTSVAAAQSGDLQQVSSSITQEKNISEDQQLTKKGQPRRRKKTINRVRNACDECRRRHVPCNEVSAGEYCKNCKERDVECTWNHKLQKESGQTYYGEDEEYLEQRERPKIFHYFLPENTHSLMQKPHHESGFKSDDGALFKPKRTKNPAKNPVAGSENFAKRSALIYGDAPYASGAHHPPHRTLSRPLLDEPEQNNQNVPLASLPLSQCPNCSCYHYVVPNSSHVEHPVWENSAAFFPTPTPEYQSYSPSFVYDDTTVNQFLPQRAPSFCEINDQNLSMTQTNKATYSQDSRDWYDNGGNAPHNCHQNDW